MTGSSKETLGQKAVARSQHSIRLVERNGVFERASRVENPDLTRAKARSASSVVNRLLSTQKHRLHARRLTDLSAVYNDAGNVIETHDHAGDFKVG